MFCLISEPASGQAQGSVDLSRTQTICLANRQTSEVYSAVQYSLEQVPLTAMLTGTIFWKREKKQLLAGEGKDLSLTNFLLFPKRTEEPKKG